MLFIDVGRWPKRQQYHVLVYVMKEAPTFNQTTLMALQHSLATALWLKLYIDTEKRNIANAWRIDIAIAIEPDAIYCSHEKPSVASLQWSRGYNNKIMRCHVFLDLTYIYGTISLHVLSTAQESLLIIMPLYPQVFGVKRWLQVKICRVQLAKHLDLVASFRQPFVRDFFALGMLHVTVEEKWHSLVIVWHAAWKLAKSVPLCTSQIFHVLKKRYTFTM